MNIDLGLFSAKLPEGSALKPAMMLLAGKTDEQAALQAGPTLAKTETHSYQRTLAISLSPFPENADADEALNFGLNQLQKNTDGKVSNTKDETIDGCPARSVELRYTQRSSRAPVLTRAYLVLTKGYLQSFVLTALDNPKTLPDALREFDTFMRSVKVGTGAPT